MRTIISVVTGANDRDGAIWGESRDGDARPFRNRTRLCEVRMRHVREERTVRFGCKKAMLEHRFNIPGRHPNARRTSTTTENEYPAHAVTPTCTQQNIENTARRDPHTTWIASVRASLRNTPALWRSFRPSASRFDAHFTAAWPSSALLPFHCDGVGECFGLLWHKRCVQRTCLLPQPT
jgi:hypothetical protein